MKARERTLFPGRDSTRPPRRDGSFENHFSGVGKTREEIGFALDSQIGQLNVESVEELKLINEIAAAKNLRARVSILVNPDVDAGTHEKIATGRKSDKFGIPWSEAWDSYQMARGLSHLEIEGLAFHIGSQITELTPIREALTKAVELVQRLQMMASRSVESMLAAGSAFATTMKLRSHCAITLS